MKTLKIFEIDIFNNYFVIKENNDKSAVILSLSYQGYKRLKSINEINPFHYLEHRLKKLVNNKTLKSAVFYIGFKSDPFYPYQEKFNVAKRILNIFSKYKPKKVIINTRSTLCVLAMTELKELKDVIELNFYLETTSNEIASKFTPGLTAPSDRIKAIRTMRAFKIPVSITVAPVLPYGDWIKDSMKFAKVLTSLSDKIFVKNMLSKEVTGVNEVIKILKYEKKLNWLRLDTHIPLINSIKSINETALISDLDRFKAKNIKQQVIFAKK